jgi:hypothetical protein
MFAALKSRGFDLEATNLTDPRRVERLIGLLALAFNWTRLVGDRRARREGPPPVKTHGRRERSLFRYGLDRLQNILTTPEPQPKAFFEVRLRFCHVLSVSILKAIDYKKIWSCTSTSWVQPS